jgi:hypothetical protein
MMGEEWRFIPIKQYIDLEHRVVMLLARSDVIYQRICEARTSTKPRYAYLGVSVLTNEQKSETSDDT